MRMSYATLRWKSPDLEPALEALREVGWDGWEGRLPLDWLGPPKRLRRICDNAGMPMVVYAASGSPDDPSWENVEQNRRRMDFAAEMEVDCFMVMNGPKPDGIPVADDDVIRAAERTEAWAEYASQYELVLTHHNHTNLLVDSVEHWKLFASLLRETKLCIDFSHAQLWGYDPVESIHDFRDQLHYVHLQDYSRCTRDQQGVYHPTWVDVGSAESQDFRKILEALGSIGFSGWVTSCPADECPSDPAEEARGSRSARSYLHSLGF